MDLYDESEHVISSDEYSNDDDDDDALMNDAIRAQDNIYERFKDFNHGNNEPKFDINPKQRQLSSLIRKNKIFIIYKNKSIKWLNGKQQRERYKGFLYKNKGEKVELGEIVKNDAKETAKIETGPVLVQSSVSITDSDNESTTNIKSNEREPLKIANANADVDDKFNAGIQDIIEINDNAEKVEKASCGIKKENMIPEKRERSLTPKIVGENSELKQSEKRKRIESPQFYKDINDMFPKFDNIASEHINTITNNILPSVEEKLKELTKDINTLSEILKTKEMEWNRLLHLKMVKEEIYSRLRQKRQHLIIEKYSKMDSHKNLEDLKELELYLSAEKPDSPSVNLSTITIQKLVENRANMNAEDLEREKNNTSRLHSLLVSSNMLHGKETPESVSPMSNGKRSNPTSKNEELFKQFEKEAFASRKGRQGKFRDVKSIIADFRQKNPEILPLSGNNLRNSVLEQNNISIPVHDKKISSQYLNIRGQSDTFPRGNHVEEISISPIGRFKKLTSNHNNDSISTMNNHFNIVSEHKDLKNRNKSDMDGKLTKINYPLCQECKTNESRFVCAGCGNQWYCSKKCQVSAWDTHSDFCTE